MALPQRHTVTANVQVTGGAARVVALQCAAEISSGSGKSASEVLVTARMFQRYLEEDGEQGPAAVQPTDEGE